MPTPEKFFDMAFAFERTAAINAAVDLDVFTAVGEGAETVTELSTRCATSERGMRILCDFLTINGLLTKDGERYQLTPDSAAFLAKSSPAYLGGTLLSDATPYVYPLRPRTNFLIELDEIPESTLARTRILYLNYPNNPTSAIAPREYLERLDAWKRRVEAGGGTWRVVNDLDRLEALLGAAS